MQKLRAIVRDRRFLFGIFPLIVMVVSWATSEPASAQYCPPGSVPVYGSGGGYACRCPDGSWASYGVPCRAPAPRCPANTTYCHGFNFCCNNDGWYCSRYGCIQVGSIECGGHHCNPGQACMSGSRCMPAGAQECSNGAYCDPGKKCWDSDGKTKCVPAAYAHAHQHAKTITKWLDENNARARSTFEERHERAKGYVRDNKEVKRHVEALVARGLVGNSSAADVYSQIQDIISDIDDFRHGRYFDGALRITNQVSSAFLDYHVPGSGAATDIMSLGAAVGTAYAYGFFWGQ